MIEYYENEDQQCVEKNMGFKKIISTICKANSHVFGMYGRLLGTAAGILIGGIIMPLYQENERNELLNHVIHTSSDAGYYIGSLPVNMMIGVITEESC
jgi:hypothetical protein